MAKLSLHSSVIETDKSTKRILYFNSYVIWTDKFMTFVSVSSCVKLVEVHLAMDFPGSWVKPPKFNLQIRQMKTTFLKEHWQFKLAKMEKKVNNIKIIIKKSTKAKQNQELYSSRLNIFPWYKMYSNILKKRVQQTFWLITFRFIIW